MIGHTHRKHELPQTHLFSLNLKTDWKNSNASFSNHKTLGLCFLFVIGLISPTLTREHSFISQVNLDGEKLF